MTKMNIDLTQDFDWKAEVLEDHAARATSDKEHDERTWALANHLIETNGTYPSWAFEEAELRIRIQRTLLRGLEQRHPPRS
ncbi:hypothetical protein [Myxococcus sp. CA039A]|uniref:hypothetical protein n=1 Tax=Myxococcus sp. CA039A TaxID=2741737 RepID=UPI00157B2D5C|nr:hypothetical protein [Myxococcus sp. CA039A]NTX56804.1 hypothetical protein [Myxococcus sp. CA039A]